ncbi:MAG: flippase activity-associated protein Agl23, partial [Halolamina sp.]
HFGPTAFAARLPVALVGGLAPLSALLFRRPAESLSQASTTDSDDGDIDVDEIDGCSIDADDDNRLPQLGLTSAETVALAALLAVTPSLVYYSRFMRSDVPLAVLSLVALGFATRTISTGRRRHVVAAGLFVGLAIPTKENVLLYAACAVGAAAVAVCWPAVARFAANPRDPAARGAATRALSESLARARSVVGRHLPAVPVALLVALVPVVFFLAPRGPAGDPTLGAALAGDAGWQALVERATVGTWETFRASTWVEERGHSIPIYAGKLWGYLLVGALPVVVGAGYAFVREVRNPSRPLVVPLVAWSVAAMLGYPLATDIPAPWLSVHFVTGLLVPAAVGWVTLVRERPWEPLGGTYADDRRRYFRYALAALVVLSVVHVPVVIAASSITPPLSVNVLAQSAQPPNDLSPMQATVTDAADSGGVLFYGEEYTVPNESVADRPPDRDADWLGSWLNRLPMAWYVEQAGAPSAAAEDRESLRDRESIPPVVFVDPAEADEVAPMLPDRGYEQRRYELGLYHDQAVVVFVDDSRMDGEE